MTRQYLRKCSLVVGDPSGKALDLSDLHVRFTVWQGTTQSPHQATVRVYNLSDATKVRVQQEFTQLQLQAGYDGIFGQLLLGTLIQKRAGRENGVDTFLEMIAVDGDTAYNQSVINTTLAAGASPTDIQRSIVKALSDYGVSMGGAPELPATQLPRGKVMFGMTRDHLRQHARATDTTWNFSAGQINFIPVNGYLGDPGQALVLTAQTGMIGLPTQALDGIIVRCLLNPNVKVGTLIKLDNASIQQARFSADYQALNEKLPSLADDGIYKVLAASHVGDTRGNEWYTNIVCSSINGTQPYTQSTLSVVP
jgi:hypothetical protein